MGAWFPLVVPSFLAAEPTENIFLLRHFFCNHASDTTGRDYGRASKFRIWSDIILPLARPALAAVIVLTFLSE